MDIAQDSFSLEKPITLDTYFEGNENEKQKRK